MKTPKLKQRGIKMDKRFALYRTHKVVSYNKKKTKAKIIFYLPKKFIGYTALITIFSKPEGKEGK